MKTQPLYRIAIIFSLIVCFSCSKDSTEEDTVFDPELYTHIPDDKFEELLIDRRYNNKMDDYVLTSKIKNVEELSAFGCDGYACFGRGISDFTGLQDFRSLKFLDCRLNRLTTLDVSENKELVTLNCSQNQIKNLNLSENTKLTKLSCQGNNLTNLFLSNNINLEYLAIGNKMAWIDEIGGNNITNIDISNNLALRYFYCDDNILQNLNTSQNINLITLSCTNNNLQIIDIVQNVNLNTLRCYDNNLTTLDVSNNTKLEYLNCTNNNIICVRVNINQLNGISSEWFKDYEALYSLDCLN